MAATTTRAAPRRRKDVFGPGGSGSWSDEDEDTVRTAREVCGWLPTQLNSLTRGVGGWEQLSLDSAGIRTLAPEILGFSAQITALYLSHNRLGCIPDEVTRLPNLRCLHIADNGISTVASSIERMQELRELDLSANCISALPLEMGRLWRLLSLNLEGNPIVFPPRPVLDNGALFVIACLRDQLPTPPEPEKRKWVPVEQVSPQGGAQARLLRVLTYNVLAELYCTPDQYPYTPSWALETAHRRAKSLDEIVVCNADVVCLQEVEARHFVEVLEPAMSAQGYGAVFKPKTRGAVEVDGCVTFFRVPKLRLIRERVVEYRQAAADERRKIPKTPDMERLRFKNNIVLICEFELGNSKVVVANTHIHWDPANSDLKLMQAQLMLEEVMSSVQQMQQHHKRGSQASSSASTLPSSVIITGDFNATPDSGVYRLLATGDVPPGHADWNGADFGPYSSQGLTNPFGRLRSAYAATGSEPEFTNFGSNFSGVLDYIWYTPQRVKTLQVLGVPALADVLARTKSPLPSVHYPSDHVPLLADFQIF